MTNMSKSAWIRATHQADPPKASCRNISSLLATKSHAATTCMARLEFNVFVLHQQVGFSMEVESEHAVIVFGRCCLHFHAESLESMPMSLHLRMAVAVRVVDQVDLLGVTASQSDHRLGRRSFSHFCIGKESSR